MERHAGSAGEGRSGKDGMIRLTRINRVPLILNSDLIEHVEATPDTVITLTSGQKLVVLESAEEVIDKVIEFRRAIAHPPGLTVSPEAAWEKAAWEKVASQKD
jgi:flagellar protein FlbD